MAMTAAERQRKRRERLKKESMKPLLVRGKQGQFDERIQVALAVKRLAERGDLPDDVKEKIIQEASKSITGRGEQIKFIQKIITEFLTESKDIG